MPGEDKQDVLAREGLFVIRDDPALIGGRCRECGRACFPCASICPYCSHEQVDEIELSRSGTLWAWTAVTAPPPGYDGPVPYGFGVVELEEGLRVISRLTEPDPAKLEAGQTMRLVLEAVGDRDGRRVLTYAFSPAGPA
ncbi:MAG: Zn-ribbon domain-containing OB-fold protein [Acidimicrobiales bacterium]